MAAASISKSDWYSLHVKYSLREGMQKDYVYNEQINAHFIESFIIVFFIYRSYMFQRQRFSLRELSLGYLNVFMQSWRYF